jgi:hypothetical protein
VPVDTTSCRLWRDTRCAACRRLPGRREWRVSSHMATIKDLIKAADDAQERATHYAAEAQRLYDLLIKSGGMLTPEQVGKLYDAVEENRSSSIAASDHLGEILKELARAVASRRCRPRLARAARRGATSCRGPWSEPTATRSLQAGAGALLGRTWGAREEDPLPWDGLPGSSRFPRSADHSIRGAG